MKRTFYFFIIFFCLNISCFAGFSGIANEEKVSLWTEMLGNWNISNQTISPDLKKAGTDFQFVLSKSDMETASRWSEISVNFKIDERISQCSAGFALNTKDSSDFGVLRICKMSNQSFLQVGWWQYGYYRPYLSVELRQNIHSGEWYNISIHPTMDIKEWRPWTITLKSCQNGAILLEQGIENELPLFGRGITGLYAKGGEVSFKNFQIYTDSSLSRHRYLKLAPLFTDGMVIQRNMLVPIWGRTKPCEMVKVKVNNHVFTTSSDSLGDWRIDLAPMKASNSVGILVVSAKDSIILRNVAIGEVWLASGQSNMNMKVWQSDIDSLSKKILNDTSLRMFIQPQWPSDTPIFESGGKWEYAESENTKNWSAVAYGFALQLREKLKVPVGIICSYWGGTAAESWFPREELDKDTITKPILESYNRAQTALENRRPPVNIHSWNIPGQSHAPGYLYNGMIHPHIPAAIRGVIWYQGESNAERAKQYEVLFPMLIHSWRQLWDHPDMYFFFVQLAGYDGKQSGSNIESAWPQLREAQRLTLQKLDHTGMVVTIDIGNIMNIHPIHKKEVGERLSRIALHDVYGFKDIVRCGPLFKSATFKRNYTSIYFTETALGLQIKNGKIIEGFMVAGIDEKFFPAYAQINTDGKSVRVWSEKVDKPVAVRYVWENYSGNLNLINSAGLPASPFRTDAWSLPTDKNR